MALQATAVAKSACNSRVKYIEYIDWALDLYVEHSCKIKKRHLNQCLKCASPVRYTILAILKNSQKRTGISTKIFYSGSRHQHGKIYYSY